MPRHSLLSARGVSDLDLLRRGITRLGSQVPTRCPREMHVSRPALGTGPGICGRAFRSRRAAPSTQVTVPVKHPCGSPLSVRGSAPHREIRFPPKNTKRCGKLDSRWHTTSVTPASISFLCSPQRTWRRHPRLPKRHRSV
uniref:Uncharacterized protein n=1 Tax=Rhodococcus sp. B264-1 TaxID=233067 RepID=Q7X2T0_9NOCA|nr:hypothetical protein [Rhodococcus sp. B264-1]